MRLPSPTLAAVAMVALALAGCTRGGEGDGTAPTGHVVTRTNEPLPELSGETLDGGDVSTKDFVGDVLVLNVWASWCGPCTEELPALATLSERYADEGVAFLGINYNNGRAEAMDWAERYGIPYPSLYDPDGSSAYELGYPGLPDTFVVDHAGNLRIKIFGATTEQELAPLIDEVLAEADTAQ